MAGKRKTQIYTVNTIKGGTSKTATTVTLAAAAIRDNKKALVCDMDPQGSATIWLKGDFSRPGCYEVLTGQADVKDAIQPTESGIDAMSGGANLTVLETRPGSAQRLHNALRAVSGRYDVILIDTAAGMNEALNNALFASTGAIIPLLASSLSLQSLYQIVEIVNHVQETNKALKMTGTFISQFDSRPKINRFMRDTIKERAEAAGVPYLGEIRRGVAVTESEAMQETLFNYAGKSKPAQDYELLYKKITEGTK